MEWLSELFTDYTLRTVALGSALLGITSGALGGFAVVKAPLSPLTRGALNVAAIGFGGLLYALLDPYLRRITDDPVRALRADARSHRASRSPRECAPRPPPAAPPCAPAVLRSSPAR